jgi:membrane-associated protease RseP (regulator of RpoE activity)
MNKCLVWLGIALAVVAGCSLSLLGGALAGGVVAYLAGHQGSYAVAPRVWLGLAPPLAPSPAEPERWPHVPDSWEMPSGFVCQLDGALITEVVPDAPAQEAGLEVGHIIIAVDNRALDERHDLSVLIRRHEPGEQVVLTVLRRGQDTEMVEIEVTLARERDESGEMVAYLGVWYEFAQGGMYSGARSSGPRD